MGGSFKICIQAYTEHKYLMHTTQFICSFGHGGSSNGPNGSENSWVVLWRMAPITLRLTGIIKFFHEMIVCSPKYVLEYSVRVYPELSNTLDCSLMDPVC